MNYINATVAMADLVVYGGLPMIRAEFTLADGHTYQAVLGGDQGGVIGKPFTPVQAAQSLFGFMAFMRACGRPTLTACVGATVRLALAQMPSGHYIISQVRHIMSDAADTTCNLTHISLPLVTPPPATPSVTRKSDTPTTAGETVNGTPEDLEERLKRAVEDAVTGDD